MAELTVAKGELQAIMVPAVVMIGDRDPIRELYVDPLQAVRKETIDRGNREWIEMNRSR